METVISLVSLIVTILSLFWTIYKDTSLNNNSNSDIIISNSNITNNINSIKNITNIDNSKNATYINNTHSNSNSYNNSSENNDFILFFIFLIIGCILYSEYSNIIIITTSIIGILSLITTLFCFSILLKKRLVSRKTYIYSFIRYVILFLCIIFISNPLYNREIASTAEDLLKNGSGLMNVFISNPLGIMSITCKIASVGIIISQFILSFKLIIVTYKHCNKSLPLKILAWKDIKVDAIVFSLLLLFSSGLFVKIFDQLQSIKI